MKNTIKNTAKYLDSACQFRILQAITTNPISRHYGFNHLLFFTTYICVARGLLRKGLGLSLLSDTLWHFFAPTSHFLTSNSNDK